MTEYAFAASYLLHLLQNLLPTQWKWNIIAFDASIIYYIVMVKITYDKLTVEFVLSALLAMFYYSISAIVLNKKNRNLYQTLLQNQKLNKEMKKILEIFPEGVIITTSDSEIDTPKERNLKESQLPSVLFTNHKFDLNICDLKSSIKELKDVVISYETSEPETGSSDEVVTTLNDFLKNQEQKLLQSNSKMTEQNNIKLKCTTDTDLTTSFYQSIKGDESSNFKIFKIKTLNVNWENHKNSCMHVFIDTTDIRKLEEAHNDIR